MNFMNKATPRSRTVFYSKLPEYTGYRGKRQLKLERGKEGWRERERQRERERDRRREIGRDRGSEGEIQR